GPPSNGTVLARTLQSSRVVLGIAGLEAEAAGARRDVRRVPFRTVGPDPRPLVRRFDATLHSAEEIDRVVKGHGLLSVDTERGVVRRMPLVAAVGDALIPAFGIELLRVAADGPVVTVRTGASGVEAVAVGDLVVPTEPDGSVRVHFSRSDPARFVSAADVLAGKVDRRILERKLVLIGVTALGLSDYQATPVADRMPGVEIPCPAARKHLGRRPPRAATITTVDRDGSFLVGIAMLWVVERAAVWVTLMAAASLAAALVGVPMGVFRSYGILLDPIPAPARLQPWLRYRHCPGLCHARRHWLRGPLGLRCHRHG